MKNAPHLSKRGRVPPRPYYLKITPQIKAREIKRLLNLETSRLAGGAKP